MAWCQPTVALWSCVGLVAWQHCAPRYALARCVDSHSNRGLDRYCPHVIGRTRRRRAESIFRRKTSGQVFREIKEMKRNMRLRPKRNETKRNANAAPGAPAKRNETKRNGTF